MKTRAKTKALSEREIDDIVIAQANDASAWSKPIKVAGKMPMSRSAMKVLNYRILLRKEPEGGYTVIVPSLAGCVTYGKTIDEAIKMAKEAIALYLESLKAHGEEIPTEEGTLEYTLTLQAYA
jgi:predicted RNase H-like HicB family nuclease